jgi:hypothetical protein
VESPWLESHRLEVAGTVLEWGGVGKPLGGAEASRHADPDPTRPGVADPKDRLRHLLGHIEAQAEGAVNALRHNDASSAERAMGSVLDLVADALQLGDHE